MTALNYSSISCGVWEMDGIGSPEFALGFLMDRITHRDLKGPAFLIWSNIERDGIETSGHRFAKFVDGRFGKVVKSETARNPNTGNPIVIWQWSIDWDKVKEWNKERLKLKEDQRFKISL